MDRYIVSGRNLTLSGQDIVIGPFCVLGNDIVIGERAVLGVGCVIGDGVTIASGVKLGSYVTVGSGAAVAENVTIADHTVIYPGTTVGSGSYIGSNSAIGRPPRAAATSTVKHQGELPALVIGSQTTIGCSAVIYAGTTLADAVFVGDGALIRERCTIGAKVVVGSGSAVENDTSIGAYTKIQTGSYITAYMEIGENVFIAPMVTTTNDNYMGRTEKRFQSVKGAVIRRGARIGGGAILLPGVEVAEETFVAAGALVSKATAARRVVKGFPAKEIRDVPAEELLDYDLIHYNELPSRKEEDQ